MASALCEGVSCHSVHCNYRENEVARHLDIHVPILIVGGGGAGLTASVLLSRLGVRSILVSRFAETSRLPKAHMLNQRTMEVFADAGVGPAIVARGTFTDWAASPDRKAKAVPFDMQHLGPPAPRPRQLLDRGSIHEASH